MKNKRNNNEMANKFNRRDFLKSSALLGGSAALVSCGVLPNTESIDYSAYPLNDAENFIYSVCLQCHTDCPIKVKIQNGVAVKIDGNPYSIQTLNPAIPYKTSINTGAKIDGGICPKGQAGLQTLYDPYRLVKVIKRTGKRGENKWKVISFEQAVNEIVNGGKLFADVPGEEKRVVKGLKDIYKLRESALSKSMASDAKDVGKGKMSVNQFKKKYYKYLDTLIDPNHPDFGPVNNQFVFQAGRIEHGRKEFSKRWLKNGFGSNNWFEHTTICEQSHHIAYAQMTNQYLGNGKYGKGKHHMKPDLHNAEFVIFFGTGAFEANFGPPYLSNLVTNNISKGKLKIAVVDPRFSKTASKAWKWLPVKPGEDTALAYAMINWMISNEKYDKKYLINSNKAAAKKDRELTWTNATWLVKIEKDGPGALLRGSDIGSGRKDDFVTTRDGRLITFNTNDDKKAVEGDLFCEGTINAIKVKSVFKLIADYANSKSLEKWAAISGINVEDIIAISSEFAKHGKKSGVESYRGPVQHTSGYYNAQVLTTLNMLVGNPSWKGGLTAGGGKWYIDGSKSGQPFNFKKGLHPNKLSSFGVKINREGMKYEDSTLFREKGYPAKRPWFPHTSNVYQEIIPSAQDGYPYKIEALMLHMGTPVFSSPAGHKMIEALTDFETTPLFIASDIVIAETSMYADYIFPDSAIWERWGTPGTTPEVPIKHTKVRQPTVDPLVEKVKVFGEEMYCSMETLMLAIAEKLSLPGYGKNGFGKGLDFTRPDHFYLKMVANIAAGSKPGDAVPDADANQVKIFRKARRHLSKLTFDERRWEKAVVDAEGRNWWKKVIYILNKGGRYEDFDKYLNSGDYLPHPFKGQFNLYIENVAQTRHPYTGERFSGISKYYPVLAYNGKEVVHNDYPFKLITYKEITGGQSRTAVDYWIMSVLPENKIIINAKTAKELGLKNDDLAKIVSPTNPDGIWDLKNGEIIPVQGKVHVKQGIRPGVIAVSWHYGHWAYGGNDVVVDGELIKGEKFRRGGLCPNSVMEVDPVLKNVTLQDVIGGSASYYDSKVNLVKLKSS
jgi:anaerobic selenocysteine-containing dehydrogenase